MSSAHSRLWSIADMESREYVLPPGTEIAKEAGESVRAGDIIARLPPLAHLVALADSLRLSHLAGIAAIQSLDGKTIVAGDILGTHRIGIRTRTLRASCSGSIRGIPEHGALAIISDEEHHVLRADRPGIIASTEPDRITIRSRVLRSRLAIATGASAAIGRLVFAPDRSNRVSDAHERENEDERVVTAFPSIASIASLTAALRSARGPIIVGAVSDAVAWDMLTREGNVGDGDARPVVVVSGSGNDDSGERAIAPLRKYEGAMIELAPYSGAATVFIESLTEDRWVDTSLERDTNGTASSVQRDGTHRVPSTE